MSPDDAAKVKNEGAVWAKIEADFKFAVDNLPATFPEAGRANKIAAQAYLGKLYLYQKKFAEALRYSRRLLLHVLTWRTFLRKQLQYGYRKRT